MTRPSFTPLAAVLAAFAPFALAACHTSQPSRPAPAETATVSVLPGDRALSPPRLGPESQRYVVRIRAPRDTAERTMAHTVRALAPVAAEPAHVLVTSVWEPPYISLDSVIVDRGGLTPVRELLAYNGFTRVYHYDGARVWGSVQHGDSTPRPFDRTFPERVFAFSEVELLVRSLPFAPGRRTVVPLFSESDEAVEHDTITIVRPDTARRAERAWVVRFADPAIVTTYVIGASSRAILSAETFQRRTGAVLRYIPAMH